MAVNYNMVNYLPVAAKTVVGASATETALFTKAEVNREDSLNIKIKVRAPESIETTGISWKLQHSFDQGSSWEDVNPGGVLATGTVNGTLILADATVITVDDDVVLASHGFTTGQELFYHCDGAGIITGLTNNTTFFAIFETSGKFQLATTRALALAGTAIVLTQPAGGDGHFFTPPNSELALNIENSTDEPVLALYPTIRVVATTGALDTFTVTDVFVTRRV